MKKRTISKLKSIFGSKKGKRQHQQESVKSSRASTPEPAAAGEAQEFRQEQRTSPPPPYPRPPPSPPVPTNPIIPVPPEPPGPISFKPCPVCGRTFNPDSFSKHVNICQKMAAKKRKMFDSSRQRREGLNAANEAVPGTDLEQFLPKNFGLPENSPFIEKSPPHTAKLTPKPRCHNTSSVKSLITKPSSDLQRCPHCSRAFGMRAFERHVEWCADKAKILPAAPAQPPPHLADAKQRLNARTQYKAPLCRGRRKTSQSRDKSHSRSGSVESSRGVSPPRDFGDYKHMRTRASESMSSTEYHEETSPHVPVIRNSRALHASVSGDAVKARQARLARDLSSSRHSQESNPREPNPPSKERNEKNSKEYPHSERHERYRHPSPIHENDDPSPSINEDSNDKLRPDSKCRPEVRKKESYQTRGRLENSPIPSPRHRSNYARDVKTESRYRQPKSNERPSLQEDVCCPPSKKQESRESPLIKPETNCLSHGKMERKQQRMNDRPSSRDDVYCLTSKKENNREIPSPRIETKYLLDKNGGPMRNNDRHSLKDENLNPHSDKIVFNQPPLQVKDCNSPLENNERSFSRIPKMRDQPSSPIKELNCIYPESNNCNRSRSKLYDTSSAQSGRDYANPEIKPQLPRDEIREITMREAGLPILQINENENLQDESNYLSSEKINNDLSSSSENNNLSNKREYALSPLYESSHPNQERRENDQAPKSRYDCGDSPTNDDYSTRITNKNISSDQDKIHHCQVLEAHKHLSNCDDECYPTSARCKTKRLPCQSSEIKEIHSSRSLKRPTTYTIAFDDRNDGNYRSTVEKCKNTREPESNFPPSPRYYSDKVSPRKIESSHLLIKQEPNQASVLRENTVNKKRELRYSPRENFNEKIHLPVRSKHSVSVKNEAMSLKTDECNIPPFPETGIKPAEVEKNNQSAKRECMFPGPAKDDINNLPSSPVGGKITEVEWSTSRHERYLPLLNMEESNDTKLKNEKIKYPPAERFTIKNSPKINKQHNENYNRPLDDLHSDTCVTEDEPQKQVSAGFTRNYEENKYRKESIKLEENHSILLDLEISEDDEQNINTLKESTQFTTAPEESNVLISSGKEISDTSMEKHKSISIPNKTNATKENEKMRTRMRLKKEQKLKNLEELAQKYEERTKKHEDQERLDGEKLKSLIPVSKNKNKNYRDKCDKKSNLVDEIFEDKNATEKSNSKENTKKTNSSTKRNVVPKPSREKTATKKTNKLVKGSTMSLDSLESEKSQDFKSAGMKTELLCPCVPCIIHKPGEQKTTAIKKNTTTNKNEVTRVKVLDNPKHEPKLELVYKNDNLVSACVTTKIIENVSLSTPNLGTISNAISENSIDNNLISIFYNNNHTELDEIKHNVQEKLTNENIDDMRDAIPKQFEQVIEQKHSNPEEFFENEYISPQQDKTDAPYVRKQESSETYTNFSPNLDDLNEFLNITDKMMYNKNESTVDLVEEELIETLHTPKTQSVEALSFKTSETFSYQNFQELKPHFTDTFEDLKSNLMQLLNGTGKKISQVMHDSETNQFAFEEMAVNQIKREDRQQSTVIESSSEVKLPSINLNNKPDLQVRCSQKDVKNIYKSIRSFKKDKYESQRSKENEDKNSNNNGEPPLKLPRIEEKGLDDNYDPFASAARQMKELMSSDTNLPKKVLDSYKDPNRTLPILRPKEKKNLSTYRSDNTKFIKDSLNKSYQKTPTLQRLKSFGGSNNDNQNNSFGGRCSSFRLNRQTSNDKKSSQKLNTTFTKSSKENIVTAEKSYFNRNSNLNRSFSSYTASSYSTPKPKDKVPKIASSLSHSFQRTTIKQPVKLDKIKKDNDKKDFVNLDSILTDSHISDNSSMTDSNYIDPRLINENDNLPINVNTILNNPDILSSMESLLTQHKDILPTKFDSFSPNIQNNKKDFANETSIIKLDNIKRDNINNNLNNKIIAPLLDDLSIQYDKIMSSLEQSIDSKTSIRDDDSVCEDFDLEEFMTSFDEEVNKQKMENKRTCSSTTRVVKPADLADDITISDLKDINISPKVVCNGSNGLIPVNKSTSLNFSSNNIVSENLFPQSMKRSNSLIESMQRKPHKTDSGKSRQKSEQLEHEIMRSQKEIDQYFEEKCKHIKGSKDRLNGVNVTETMKREKTRTKSEKVSKSGDNTTNGNYTPNGKCSDSAYSSLNRISPSKLSVCNSKTSNGLVSLEQIPAESDSSGCQKDDLRSLSSEEFLAMERSAELGESVSKADTHVVYKETDNHEKRTSSRASSRLSGKWRSRQELSSSGSEASLSRPRRDSAAATPPVRLSRFCHECGSKFPVDTAKFCIECGVKRLIV